MGRSICKIFCNKVFLLSFSQYWNHSAVFFLAYMISLIRKMRDNITVKNRYFSSYTSQQAFPKLT